MKNFLIAFIIFLIWSFFALWLYSWLNPTDIASVSSEKSNIEILNTFEKEDSIIRIDSVLKDSDTISSLQENIEVTENVENNKKGVSAIKMDGSILFSFEEGIKITENQKTINIPENIGEFKYMIKNYLDTHTDKEVHIEALYSPAERFETPNFGQQRGEAVKNVLLSIGIPSERILVKSKIKGIEFSDQNMYDYGINFTFATLDSNRKTTNTKIPDVITVYPTFSDKGIQVNEQLRLLLEEVKTLTQNNARLKVNVVGHTDNIGNANDNYRSGLVYARQVRWYLVNKGKIDRNMVIARSEGEAKSIASNNSERGRKINKRIEVYFNLEE